MNNKTADKLNYIETCINDMQNFIQMFRDGVYKDDTDEFWTDISFNAECIASEAMKDQR